MNYKSLIIISLILSHSAFAQEHGNRGHHPEFSVEQKSCLAKILGEPGSGERPSREKMEAALSSCNIERPKGPPDHEESAAQ